MFLLTTLKQNESELFNLSGGLFATVDERDAVNEREQLDSGTIVNSGSGRASGPKHEKHYAEREIFSRSREEEAGTWRITYKVFLPRATLGGGTATRVWNMGDFHIGTLRETANKAVLYSLQMCELAVDSVKREMVGVEDRGPTTIRCHWKVFDPAVDAIVAAGIVPDLR